MLIKLSNYFLLLVSLLTLSFSVKAQIAPPTTLTCEKGYKLDTVFDFEMEPVTVYDYDPVERRNISRTEWQNVRKLRWKCVPVTPEPKSVSSTSSSGEFEKVWVDHSVYEDEEKGMQIHAKFDARNLKGKECRVNAYFYYASGKPLKDSNGEFKTTDGNVATHEDFTPSYASSTFNDLKIFMPYSELHTGTGKYDLKFVLKLSCEGFGFLAESENYEFSFSRPK